MTYIGDKAIDAALFDLDGTLVHSHIDFKLMRVEMLRIASEYGVSSHEMDGREILEMVDAAADHVSAGERDSVRQTMRRRLEEIEHQGCRGATPIPGAGELLQFLRCSDVKIGIVTRNCRAVSEPLLKELGLECDVLLTRDDVNRCKPDPAHLRDALAVLNVADERSMMAGDHWLDVRAGRECGCAYTLGVLGERPPTWFDSCPPDAVVRDLQNAQALFHD